MPPFSRLRTCVLAAAFSLTAAGALTAAPQQHAPDTHMSVSLYQGKALSFNEQIGAVFVAQPSIASYQVVGNRKVVVFGSYPGKTSLMVLGTDGRTLYNGLVEVAYDVSSMEKALKSSFPKLKLQLVALNDGVAVRGKVETAQEAANVVAFLDAMLQVNPQQAQMAAADVSAAGQEGQQEKSGAATGTGTLGARYACGLPKSIASFPISSASNGRAAIQEVGAASPLVLLIIPSFPIRTIHLAVCLIRQRWLRVLLSAVFLTPWPMRSSYPFWRNRI